MFKLPNLPYRYNALEHYIDEQTMKIHHNKHHAGYVNKLNAALEGKTKYQKFEIEELLTKLQDLPSNIKTAVKNNAGGHFNHSLFWQVMGPDVNQKPSADLKKATDNTFGGMDVFIEKFSDTALGRFGSGWAWTVVNKGKLEIIDTPNQDTPLTIGKHPILGIDVWEHAYYLKYQNKRDEYIKAWWKVINWKKVSKNFENLVK